MGVVRQGLTSVRLGKPSNDPKENKIESDLGFLCVLTFFVFYEQEKYNRGDERRERGAPAPSILFGIVSFLVQVEPLA